VTTFYALAARLSGIAAVVCAVLALLSSPTLSRADEYDCWQMCELNHPPATDYDGYMTCSAECSIQGTQCPSNVQNGKYVNCVNPGLACMNGTKASTCQDGTVECHCPRPKE